MFALALASMLCDPTACSRVVTPEARLGDALDRASNAVMTAQQSICGNRGRRGELARIDREIAALQRQLPPHAPELFMDDRRGDCSQWGNYRRSVNAARLALAEAAELEEALY